MAKTEERLAHILLRYAAQLSGLRRVPIVADVLSWTSRRLVPPGTLIWVQIQDGPAQGLWIRVNPRTGSNTEQGTDEPAVQEAVSKYLRSGMTFYDLGANIGFFSLLASRIVGPTGRVVSFEADPEIAARLSENLAFNKFTNASVEQKAVWSESGTIAFSRADTRISPDRGLGHVSVKEAETTQTISVGAVSLDQYTESHPEPDFVKCDVEGAEVAVFEGAARLLGKKRPILLVEMHSPENHRRLTEKFAQLCYVCTNLDANHILALPPK
jgi:FkbM family methyltransferase